MSEEHKANADKMKAEAMKFKKEASNANATSLALKQKLEELKAEQQRLVDAADVKGFQEGIAEATKHYKQQVESLQDKAYGVGFIHGLKAAGIPETFELYKAMPKYPRQRPAPAPAPAATPPEVGTPAEDIEKPDSPTETEATDDPKP